MNIRHVYSILENKLMAAIYRSKFITVQSDRHFRSIFVVNFKMAGGYSLHVLWSLPAFTPSN